MIIFLYGTDTFRSREQLKKMIEKFKTDRDPGGYNIARIDVEKEGGKKVLEHVLALPFLAEKRMIVIEHLLTSKEKEIREEILKRIEEKTLPDTNILVFWESDATFKTKDAKALFDRLLKEKYAQKFDPLSPMQLEAWILTEAEARGGKMTKTVLPYLVQHVGTDIWRMSSLIDQLIAFKNGEEITNADAQLFLNEKVDDNIFNLVDAIVGKRPKHVFAMIEEQYRLGKDAGYMFAMILRQFRILLEIRDLFDREDEPRTDQLAKRLGLHPFVVKKSLPIVRRYTMADLTAIYDKLLTIEIEAKTGGPQALLLDVFVGRVAAT